MWKRWAGPAMLWAVVVLELVVIVSSSWVFGVSRGRVVQVSEVPTDGPATLIVLGAKVDGGEPGTYLRNRLDVAVELHRDGRVETILNSGNDADSAGNEVRVMRDYLEARDIPPEAIVDDPLGVNTAATCRRAAAEFGVREALIVTQNFHVGRAVGLCRASGIDALGVVAPCDDCSGLSLTRNYLREALLSRPRAVLDATFG